MKRYLLSILSILFVNAYLIGNAQNYNDLFTTYKSVQTQLTKKKKQSSQGYQNNNQCVTQYEVMDANKFFQSVAPQNTQTVNGVFLKGGQFYSIKLKVGISGTNQNQTVVNGYWNGQMWNNTTAYASPIGYGAPEQIKRACTHQVYLPALGTIYF